MHLKWVNMIIFLSILTGLFEYTYLNSAYPTSCLFDGMNGLQKLAYNYIIPFWMLIFSWIMYHISSEDRNRLFYKIEIAPCIYDHRIDDIYRPYKDLIYDSELGDNRWK